LPIYTYQCLSCGSSLERRQSFSDDPLQTHDECGGDLKRVIHPAGIVFKGSGFYNTDYKSSTSSNGSAADAGESKTDAAKTDSASGASSTGMAASSAGSSDSSSGSSAKSESGSATPASTTT